MADIINPTNGHRGELEKRGIKPKDYISANKKQLVTTEKALSQLKNQPPPSEKLSKMKQFTQVPPRMTNRPSSARQTAQAPDFVKQNIQHALTLRPKTYELEQPQDFRETYTDYGKVPEFLHDIKEDIRCQKVKKAYEDDKKTWPKGYRLLSTKERKQRLDQLTKEREDLIARLGQFKFSANTNLRVDQKSSLEKRLTEIEFELKRLSLKKVFVRN